MSKQWCVYMVSCSDNTLYTGITNDLDRRLAAHNTGKDGARYTRSRQPVSLVYSEEAENRSNASKREWRIKRLSTAEKRKLLEKANATSTIKI